MNVDHDERVLAWFDQTEQSTSSRDLTMQIVNRIKAGQQRKKFVLMTLTLIALSLAWINFPVLVAFAYFMSIATIKFLAFSSGAMLSPFVVLILGAVATSVWSLLRYQD